MALEIAYDSIRNAVIDRKPTRAPVQLRWDLYRNDVARPPYFPYNYQETEQHYRDRLKIGVNWCGSLANRVASYFRKEPVTVTFLEGGKEEGALVDQANEVWQEVAKYNDWTPFMVDVARDAGVGGNGYTKSRFALYDAESGEELRTGDFRGRVNIDRISEVFIYALNIGGRDVLVEAWMTIDGAVQIIDRYGGSGEKVEYIELVAPALYDTTSGKKLQDANWRIWRNGASIYGPYAIPFTLPIQRFANLVSRPRSENGISDIESAIPLNLMINHVFSGASRAVQYHGEPKLKARGVEDVADIKWGTDNLVGLPVSTNGETADLEFLTWDQNLSGARTLYQDAADIMTAIAGVPKHMMHDLEGAGKVPSGVALKILYEALNQVCVLKEAGFKGSEQRTIKGALEQLAYYNGRPGLFRDLQVEVKYNPNRTPVDVEAEFKADAAKLIQNYYNLVDLVMKYEQGIETREQAMEWLKVRADEKKKMREMGLISSGFQWEDTGEQPTREDEDEPMPPGKRGGGRMPMEDEDE